MAAIAQRHPESDRPFFRVRQQEMFMPPQPAMGSRMHTAMHEPSTVVRKRSGREDHKSHPEIQIAVASAARSYGTGGLHIVMDHGEILHGHPSLRKM